MLLVVALLLTTAFAICPNFDLGIIYTHPFPDRNVWKVYDAGNCTLRVGWQFSINSNPCDSGVFYCGPGPVFKGYDDNGIYYSCSPNMSSDSCENDSIQFCCKAEAVAPILGQRIASDLASLILPSRSSPSHATSRPLSSSSIQPSTLAAASSLVSISLESTSILSSNSSLSSSLFSSLGDTAIPSRSTLSSMLGNMYREDHAG
jgi:hypothetical protein